MSPVVPASRQELQKKKINTRFLLLKLGKFPWEAQTPLAPAQSSGVPVPAAAVPASRASCPQRCAEPFPDNKSSLAA